MMKRLCVVWNDSDTPIAQVIEFPESANATNRVLDLLVKGWNWTATELQERSEAGSVHAIEMDTETQMDPRIVGTIALFRNDGEGSANIFTDLIPVYKSETAKRALMERAAPELSEFITFKVPDELLTRTYGWEGTPLLTKVTSNDRVVTTIIGFILFIDRALAKSLEIFELSRFWKEAPANGSIWRTEVVQDFSAHMQALCEDHAVDEPCPLE